MPLSGAPSLSASDVGPSSPSCPPWCTGPDTNGTEIHYGPEALFTAPEPLGSWRGPLLRVQVARLADDGPGQPEIWLDSNGGDYSFDGAGLDALIGGLEGYVVQLRGLRDRYTEILASHPTEPPAEQLADATAPHPAG